MYLIVGLGNPGDEYISTRHNLGFRVVDELAPRLAVNTFKSKHQSLLAQSVIGERKVILAKPQTFMNNSGPAVRGILEWHKILPDRLILVYDDVDLDAGKLRIRRGGNAGGHHGVESVIKSIGTNDCVRVRIGIGRENLAEDVSEYVLQNISPAQRDIFDNAVVLAASAVEEIVLRGVSAAMNRYNG